MRTTFKRFTPIQMEWLKDKAGKNKYKSKTGRVRVAKIRSAYENYFGETRSTKSLGMKIYNMSNGNGNGGKVKRAYTKRVCTCDTMTLKDIERTLDSLLCKITAIKKFVG